MDKNLLTAASYATIGLGLSQALAPQAAAKAFGLDRLDGQAEWLGRLLGTSNVAIGAMGLNDQIRGAGKPYRLGLLAANTGVTVLATAKGGLPKRTAVSVLAFLAAMVSASVQD